MMDFLYRTMGSIIHFIYFNMWPNYGVTIVILTLVIKGLLLPVAIKQQRAMVGIQKIQPHIDEIRTKYKGDMNKINEETIKLYAEHKVNPLGGCLPTLVQLPVFIALYQVIMKPLTYILNFSSDQLKAIKDAITSMPADQLQKLAQATNIQTDQIQKLTEIQLIDISRELLNMGVAQIEPLKGIVQGASSLSMDFLYLNLAQSPSITKITPLIVIPILAAVTTYLSSKLMMNLTPSAKDNQMQQSMLTTMPIVTLVVTFSLPAGLGLYWVISNVIQMIQQYFINKFIPREGVAKNETS